MTYAAQPMTGAKRKPRIMVAGEFSAGKSQLINGLLGKTLLPSNVTSTSLPPIWVIKGEGKGFRIDIKGRVHPFEGFENVEVEDTLFCLIHDDSPALEHFDLIDTPGNSDPNIPAECWERMLEFADTIVWCSNSVQAWRQSEKSVWKDIDGRLRKQAVMLMTHADRLQNDGSPEKVMRRVQRDASDFFAHFMMASLLNPNDLGRISNLINQEVLRELPLTGAYQTDVEESRREGKPATGPLVQPRRPARRRPGAAVVEPAAAQPVQPEPAPQAFAAEPAPSSLASNPIAALAAGGAAVAATAATPEAQPVPTPEVVEAPEQTKDEGVNIRNVVDLFREAGETDEFVQSPAQALWDEVTRDLPLETVVDWNRATQAYFQAVDNMLLAPVAEKVDAHGVDQNLAARIKE